MQSAAARKATSRSATALLVKNLAYEVSEQELTDLLSQQGQVLRIVVPRTRTIAVVEFGDAQEAKKAFRSLAYRPVRGVPVYLEWAPEGIFREGHATPKGVDGKQDKVCYAPALSSRLTVLAGH